MAYLFTSVRIPVTKIILKEKKKVRRIDFWNFIKDEKIAESILYDLYIENKIKFEENSSGYIIIWIGE